MDEQDLRLICTVVASDNLLECFVVVAGVVYSLSWICYARLISYNCFQNSHKIACILGGATLSRSYLKSIAIGVC